MEPSQPQARKSTPEEVRRGKTEVSLGVVAKQVVLKFPQAMEFVTFDPENARTFAEHLAAAAYEAHYGVRAPDSASEIARQARDKFTERVRVKLINRVSIMLSGEALMKMTPGERAMHIVDQVMKEVA